MKITRVLGVTSLVFLSIFCLPLPSASAQHGGFGVYGHGSYGFNSHRSSAVRHYYNGNNAFRHNSFGFNGYGYNGYGYNPYGVNAHRFDALGYNNFGFGGYSPYGYGNGYGLDYGGYGTIYGPGIAQGLTYNRITRFGRRHTSTRFIDNGVTLAPEYVEKNSRRRSRRRQPQESSFRRQRESRPSATAATTKRPRGFKVASRLAPEALPRLKKPSANAFLVKKRSSWDRKN